MGIPNQDMFTQLDLSESNRDLGQVRELISFPFDWLVQIVNNIYALARQAQALGYNGPTLGVTYVLSPPDAPERTLTPFRYYKTREDQLELERKKNIERERERVAREEYEQMLLQKRLVCLPADRN